MKTCDSDQDTCAITLVEKSLLGEPSHDLPNPFTLNPRISKPGKIIQNIVKGCESSSMCTFKTIYMNIAPNRTLRASTFCCKGTDCQKVSPELPPIHTTLNGNQCPACFSLMSYCVNDTVKCVGPESHCFTMDSNVGSTGLAVKAIMKGCSSKSYCDIYDTRKTSYRRLGFDVERLDCRASKSTGPESTGSPFLLFSGLLLMKALV
ncbi:phospholipase A2 inhibitor and Ly6/PLAUR domain-containing protein-like isoform X2 [Paroedura picta]